MIERISFGTAQVDPGSLRVKLAPGELLTVGLGVTGRQAADLEGVTASVWTNYGNANPVDFNAIAMIETLPTDGHQKAFSLTLPEALLGTFIVTAYVVIQGQRYWAQDYSGQTNWSATFGLQNRLVLRVGATDTANLVVREVPIDKANARSGSTDISLIEDLLGDGAGWYNLTTLRDEGVNCVWFQVPYRLDPWLRREGQDDAGSDYASNDWFSIDPDLSQDSRGVPPWDLDRQHELANAAMKRLVDRAHQLNMKVLVEIAPNHVGHNFIYRDVSPTGTGVPARRRDYELSAIDDAQLHEVQDRLGGAQYPDEVKDYAEYMLPQMYATRYPDGSANPFGAESVSETYSPDWYGTWADVKHLNHGGSPADRMWYPRTPQNLRVLAYIGRAMAWAATELGVDGFRIDHCLAMPFHFFEQTLPWVEMQVRERRGPSTSMIWVMEDHDRKEYTGCVADVVQSSDYMGVLWAFADQDVDRLWNAWGVVYRNREFLGTGNHDERRAIHFFDGDLAAYGNAVMTMQLLGGPFLMLAGDEYAEGEQLRFKAKGGVPTLWQRRQSLLPIELQNLAAWIGRGGTLRNVHASLRGDNRERLMQFSANGPHSIFACGRWGADPLEAPILVFSNLDRAAWATAMFDVGMRTRDWLSRFPDDWYQVRDLIGFDPDRYLWSRPVSGRVLLQQGIGVGLQASQVQALYLERVV
jgi:glycosidase